MRGKLPTLLTPVLALLLLLPAAAPLRASVGDAQLMTDHPWYPGELSCSTFDRLFKTQAALYARATGRPVTSDEDKALASWYWRNLHFAHGEEGSADCFGAGFEKGEWNREYWTGLFSHGIGLCGTTHAQYAAEMNALLGHCRSRCVGVTGHNSFEVWLAGGAYGKGQWALLDHDVSTVVFSPDGKRLLSIQEIVPQVATLKDPRFKPQRQRGWRVAGLHDGDAGVYDAFRSVEYLAGYAGVPPMAHLRRGETLRRYLKPGLEDGRTFVFWGRNYNTAGVPGPERSRTWVNQPEKMFGSTTGTGHRDGQVRYANAVYTYVPSFADGSYKEGIVSEGPDGVVFEFNSPYVIGCTPASDKPWGVYEAGGTNGLVVSGGAACKVEVSTDHGQTWQGGASLDLGNPMDLTDHVKGRRHYWLRFGAGADALKDAKLSWRTVCQANVATIPRLRDGRNRVSFFASGRAVASAGPNVPQVKAHVVDGAIGSKAVTLELAPPRRARVVRLHAAAWVASGSPPSPDVSYEIEFSTNGGKTWATVVEGWKVLRRPPEPADFWSQSFCWGETEVSKRTGPVRVRFTNNGGKSYRAAEAHLVYEVQNPTPATVTFAWRQGSGGEVKTASHEYPAIPTVEDGSWHVEAGKDVQTVWVETKAD
jgi:hypothetical protein